MTVMMMTVESYPGEILINVDALCRKLLSRELPPYWCRPSGQSQEFMITVITLEPFDRVQLKYICTRS